MHKSATRLFIAYRPLLVIAALIFCLILVLGMAPYVIATGDGNGPWADFVDSFNQGTNKDGSAVISTRNQASWALGAAEGTDAESTFFSLGFPTGTLTLQFENFIYNGPGADLKIHESTHMPYPDEKATVEVSWDGTSFVSVGEVNFDGEISFPETVSCVRFVRITNTTDPAIFEPSADGFDVDGVEALHLEGQCPDASPSPSPSPSADLTPSPSPSASPSPTPAVSPSPSTNTDSSSNSSNNASSSNSSSTSSTQPTGQVLGATTTVLASTGSFGEYAKVIAAVLGSVASVTIGLYAIRKSA